MKGITTTFFVLLVALFGYDGEVTATEGVALLLVYLIYLVALLNEVNASRGPEQPADIPVRKSVLYLVAAPPSRGPYRIRFGISDLV